MQLLCGTHPFPPLGPSATPTSLQDLRAALQPFSLLETEIAKTVSVAVEVLCLTVLREFRSVDLEPMIDISLF